MHIQDDTAVRECMSLHLDFPRDVGPEYFQLPNVILRISMLLGIFGGMLDCGAIFLVIVYSTKSMAQYKYYLLVVQTLGLLSTVDSTFFSRVVVIRLGGGVFNQASGLLTDWGMRTNPQQAVLISFLMAMYAGYLNCFIYRFQLLRNANRVVSRQPWTIILLNIFLTLLAVLPNALAFLYSDFDISDQYENIIIANPGLRVEALVPYPLAYFQTYCVSPHVKYIGPLGSLTFVTILGASLILALLTYKNVRKHLAGSKDSKKHYDLLITLILQASLPILFCLIPFLVFSLSMQTGYAIGNTIFLVIVYSTKSMAQYKYYLLVVQTFGFLSTVVSTFCSRNVVIRLRGGVFNHASGLLTDWGVRTNPQQVLLYSSTLAMYAGYLNCFIYRFQLLRNVNVAATTNSWAIITLNILVTILVVVPNALAHLLTDFDISVHYDNIIRANPGLTVEALRPYPLAYFQTYCVMPYVQFIGPHAVFTFVLILTACLIVALLGYRNVRKHLAGSTDSKKHYDLLITLVLQATLPLLFCLVPFLIFTSSIHTGYAIGNKTFTYFYVLAFPLFSAESNMVLIFRTPAYRKPLLDLFRKKDAGSSTTPAQTVSNNEKNLTPVGQG